MITLTKKEWNKLRARLAEEYPRSYLLIREKCRCELGFVTRDHKQWKLGDYGRWEVEEIVYLDFYDDAKETMFRLKYS